MHSLFAVIYGEGEGGTTPGRGTGEIVGARERGVRWTSRWLDRENKPIQRYRIQAKADKPTTLERGSAPVGVPREDGWNAPRTGRKAADIPKFATASATCPIVPCVRNCPGFWPKTGRKRRRKCFVRSSHPKFARPSLISILFCVIRVIRCCTSIPSIHFHVWDRDLLDLPRLSRKIVNLFARGLYNRVVGKKFVAGLARISSTLQTVVFSPSF